MLPVGGQILVMRVQNKSDFIYSITERFLKFHDRNSRKFVYKLIVIEHVQFMKFLWKKF